MGRGGPTAWPPRSTPDVNPLDFYPGNTAESLCWQRRGISHCGCLSDYPQLPQHLHGCGGPWGDVSKCALNLMEDILSTYYKCTLSAVAHKWMFPNTCW
jgi:hypothetical protein